MAKRNYDEDKLQAQAMSWLADAYPQIFDLCWHTANERKTKVKKDRNGNYYTPDGGRLKKKGVKRGVPDITMAYPCGGLAGLYIELKTKTLVGIYEQGENTGLPKFEKNYPSKEQRAMLARLYEVGYAVEVCWTVDEVRSVVNDYLAGQYKPSEYLLNNIVQREVSV